MSNFYCVFWYPTIFHQEKVHRDSNESTSFVEISDGDTAKGFYLKVAEIAIPDKPGCNHLKFTLTNDKTGGPQARTIESTFFYSTHTRNGFVIYTYDREKLKQDYWNVFLNSNEERSESIKKLKVRVHDRIIKKYGHLITPGEDVTPSNELIEDYVIDRILISFYHHAKGFYHEHEVQSQSDGKLVAYYYSKEHVDGHRDYLTTAPSLSNKNNEVINWYLDQFEEQFRGYAEEISKQHRDFNKRINLRRRARNALKSMLPNAADEIRECLIEYKCKDKKKERIGNTPLPIISLLRVVQVEVDAMSAEKQRQELQNRTDSTSETEIDEIKQLHDRLRVLSKLCGDALTEYTYCKALLCSKYNDDYVYDRYFNHRQVELLSLYSDFFHKLSTLDDRRKKAFNIRNSIRYIEGVKQNCSRWENELTENLIEHVHNISKNHKQTLSEIEKLSTENCKMLRASEESNLNSSLLGKYSVGLGVVSVGFAFLTIEEICSWVGYGVIAVGVIIAIIGRIKYKIEKNKLLQEVSQKP